MLFYNMDQAVCVGASVWEGSPLQVRVGLTDLSVSRPKELPHCYGGSFLGAKNLNRRV